MERLVKMFNMLQSRFFFALFPALFLIACSGTIPTRHEGEQLLESSAVLIKGRLTVPKGPVKNGLLYLNLESANQRYRLAIPTNGTVLYEVEPGLYRLTAPRGTFGGSTSSVQLEIGGTSLKLPFPKELVDRQATLFKPNDIGVMGIIDVKFSPSDDPGKAAVTVSFDDSPEARRVMLQEATQRMLDLNVDASERDALLMWAQPMERELMRSEQPTVKGR